MDDLSKIQIVTLNSPVDIWQDQNVRDLFGDMIQLKLNGYNHGYKGSSFKVLPFDSSDFYGIHDLICIWEGSQLVPLLTYKSIPLDYCQEYNHQLSIQAVVSTIEDKRYQLAMNDYIAAAEESKKRVSYNSALTIDPSLDDVELRYEIFRIFVAMAQYHMYSCNIDYYIVTTTTKFKTEKLFKKIGFKRLAYNGIDLPPAQISSLSNEEVLFFVCDRNFSPWAQRIMEEYQFLWDQRIIYSALKPGVNRKKIAA